MDALTDLTIDEASRLLMHKDISPVELTQACLDRIERLDPQINSFITLIPEAALEGARQAEAELLRGDCRGPLHGIPIAVKDLYETAGIRTTAGTIHFIDFAPLEDAYAVQKLRQAGVVLLGKLNLHEIALGVTNENPHFGACHNPWDLQRISGGSSGGSAAALAAGLCLGTLGSDTGGSIRIPASFCGVVGLKPTYGRVSLRGIMPLSWNLDHAGPLARSVLDAAYLLQAIAGYDAQDPYSVNTPVEDYLASIGAGIGGWRVGLLVGEFLAQAEPRVQQAVRQAALIFETAGAAVEPLELDFLLQAAQANGVMVVSDAATFHQQRLKTHPELFGEDVLKRLATGAALSSLDYVQARRVQSLVKRQMEEVFQQFDLLVLPSTPYPAPLLRAQDAVERAGQLTRFTAPFNLTGLPSLTLPCSFLCEDEVELPVGLQMVASAWGEVRLLRAAFAYEQATSWHFRLPPL